MKTKIVVLSLCLTALAYSQGQTLRGGDFNAGGARSTVPAVIGLGPPEALDCAATQHRGRYYTRLDATSVTSSIYICLEPTPGVLAWSVQSGNVTEVDGKPLCGGLVTTNCLMTADAGSGLTTSLFNLSLVQSPDDDPSAALVQQAGNVDNGAHCYGFAWVTDQGQTYTSSFINAGTTVTVVNKTVAGKVSVSIPVSPDARVTARNIYRTKAGQSCSSGEDPDTSTLYLIGTVADNTTLAFTDNVADSTLIYRDPTLDYANTSAGYVWAKDAPDAGTPGYSPVQMTDFGLRLFPPTPGMTNGTLWIRPKGNGIAFQAKNFSSWHENPGLEDTPGTDITLEAGRATGNSNPGKIIFRVSTGVNGVPFSSNPLADALVIDRPSGSAGKAMCWRTATKLGYCSTVVASDGSCTCN